MISEETQRITPKEALQHEWFNEENQKMESEKNCLLIERLVRFQDCSKLRKTILSFLAAKASDEDMKDEIEFFNQIDTNRDGYITLKELKSGIKKYSSYNKKTVQAIMNNIDTDHNGAISFNEFLAAVISDSISKDYSKISKAFKFFDKDNNGKIEDKELKEALTGSEFRHIETKIFTDVLKECSENDKGEINLKEFMRVMSVKIEDTLPDTLILSTNM